MKGYQYNIADELIIDNFAGGGGASTGIELATGRIVDIAINHDRAAIEMHEKNHPYTKHYCEDVWQIDPRKVTGGRPVALVWCSPDCKHFSKAKGGAPVSKKIRGLAWVALRWAATVRPRVIILENVEEFQTWGPVKDGKPVKEQSGRTFKSFVNALKRQGYAVDWRVLKACDYGAPTSRKRFFLIARSDGREIVFPEPTHGKGKGLKPYHTAAECIDFSLPCKSIFDRKRPLAANTLKRIARGMDKFVLKSPRPYIVSNNTNNAPHDIAEPLPTVTTGNRNYMCLPSLVQYHSERSKNEVRGQRVELPLNTIDASNRYGLSAAYLTKYFSGEKQSGADIGEPLPTVTAIDHNAVVTPYLTQICQTSASDRGREITNPVTTICSKNEHCLTVPYLLKYYSSNDQAQAVEEPLHTVTAKARFAVAEGYICTFRNHTDGQSVKEPLSTVTAKAQHHAAIRLRLEKITGMIELGRWPQVRELLNEYAGYCIAGDEILVLELGGTEYFISDVGMRMLEPKELAAAQGFPPDYILQVSDSYSKSAQIARIGNSVCPVMAEVLVRANLPEMCGRKIQTMEQLQKILTA